MASSDDRHFEEAARPDFSALASTVLSVLNETPPAASQTVRTSVVRKLVRGTLRESAFDAGALLGDLRDGRVAPDQIVDIYIPEAARQLGVMWEEDAIGFAAVTIATARLQGLLTHLAPSWSPATRKTAINTIMVLQPGDSHTLGLHVAVAQLRRLGASVRLLFSPDENTLMKAIADDPCDLVLFSCARAESLATVAQMVKRIRADAAGPPPIALGGLVLDRADRLKEKTGVDLVSGDVKVAFKLCDNKRLKPKSVER